MVLRTEPALGQVIPCFLAQVQVEGLVSVLASPAVHLRHHQARVLLRRRATDPRVLAVAGAHQIESPRGERRRRAAHLQGLCLQLDTGEGRDPKLHLNRAWPPVLAGVDEVEHA